MGQHILIIELFGATFCQVMIDFSESYIYTSFGTVVTYDYFIVFIVINKSYTFIKFCASQKTVQFKYMVMSFQQNMLNV